MKPDRDLPVKGFLDRVHRAISRRVGLEGPKGFLLHRLVPKKGYDPLDLQVEVNELRMWVVGMKQKGWNFCFAGEAQRSKDAFLTFDDGYADNLLVALPLLEELEVPMTLFLNTDWLDGRGQRWADQVCSRIKDPEIARQLAWKWYRDEPSSALKALIKETGVEVAEVDSAARPLETDEVRLMAKSPWVRIEAHGHGHLSHHSLTKEQLRHDTLSNLDKIEEITGRRPRSYAYPFGRLEDLSVSSIPVLEECGISSAFLAEGRTNYSWTHPFLQDRETLKFSGQYSD